MASTEYETTTNSLMEIAQRALAEAQNTRGWIGAFNSVRAPDTKFRHSVNRPSLGPAPKFSELFENGNSTAPEIIRLNNEADAWIEKYFPAINQCLRTLPEDWLCGVISGTKPFGMDKTVFEIVWHQARDRAYRSANSSMRSLEASFSSRGFSLPPGALVAALSQAESDADQAIAEVNIAQAIKDAEIKLELLKFAEEQAIRLKLGIMDAMARFYQMWLAVPDQDIERARIRAQAMSAFYAALSNYHNVEVAFEQLRLEAAKAGLSADLRSDDREMEAASILRTGLPAVGQVAQAFGNIASGAASAAGTLVAQIESI